MKRLLISRFVGEAKNNEKECNINEESTNIFTKSSLESFYVAKLQCNRKFV